MYNMGKRYLSHGRHYIFATNIKKRGCVKIEVKRSLGFARS